MGGNAKTTAQRKERISDALIELLAEKPFEKITVEDIVERAGVGRTTYFRNFKSKEEAVTFKFVQLWTRFALERNLATSRDFNLENALPFFEYNLSIRDLLQTVYDAGLSQTVADAFVQVMVGNKGHDMLTWYESLFFAYGLFGLLDGWIRSGFSESPSEMVKLVGNLVSTIVAQSQHIPPVTD